MTGLRDYLRVVGALGRRSIKQSFRRPQFLAPILLFPTLFLILNTGGAGSAEQIPGFPEVNGILDFEMPGTLIQCTLLAGVSAGIAVALDVEIGFLDRLVTAPVQRSAIIIGRLMASAVLGLLAGVYFMVLGLLAGMQVEGGVLGYLVVAFMVPMAAVAFGLIGAALALKSGKASVVQGIFPIVFVILFLSSAFFPRNLLTEPAATIADYNPMSYMAEAIRDGVISDVSLEPLLKGVAGLAVVIALGAVLCAAALRARLRAG